MFAFLFVFIVFIFLATIAGSYVRCFIDDTLTITTVKERALPYDKENIKFRQMTVTYDKLMF